MAAKSPPKNNRKRHKVVIGIIDDALAFGHERFRLPNGNSRIEYLWLQSAPHDPGAVGTPFGKEYDRSEIRQLQDAFSRGNRRDVLDEDALYRAAGALDMSLGTAQALARRSSHGTAVTDLAGGFRKTGFPPTTNKPMTKSSVQLEPEDFDLAAVCLPERLIMDTSGTFAEIFIILGMLRLISHMERLYQSNPDDDFPLIINISLGLTAGPRDGSSPLDRFIAALETERDPERAPIRVVMPAGNFRQSQVHAVLEDPLEERAPPLFWTIAPDDKTPSFLEIWSSKLETKPDAMPFAIGVGHERTVYKTTLEWAPLDGVFDLVAGEQRIARCYSQWVPSDPSQPSREGRVRATLVVPPTVPVNRRDACATPGAWRLLLVPAGGETTHAGWPLDLTIQRDDMIRGHRGGGRQSYFGDARYQRVDAAGFTIDADRPGPDGAMSHIRRAGTINALATAQPTVVVGGCYADTLKPVDYSGEAGGSGLETRGVDASAPAMMHRSRGFIRAAGARSGSRTGVAGTSIAVPIMSRELAKALLLKKDPPKLFGVSLLWRSPQDNSPPPVLPMNEIVSTKRSDGETSA